MAVEHFDFGDIFDAFFKPLKQPLKQHEDRWFTKRLSSKPRWIVGGKAALGCASSPSQKGRFETRWLAADSGRWIDSIHARRPPRGDVLDMIRVSVRPMASRR